METLCERCPTVNVIPALKAEERCTVSNQHLCRSCYDTMRVRLASEVSNAADASETTLPQTWLDGNLVTVIQPICSPSVIVITWCANHHTSSWVRRWQWRHTRKQLLHPNLPIWRSAWSTSNHADMCMVLRTISCYMLFARSWFARNLPCPGCRTMPSQIWALTI